MIKNFKTRFILKNQLTNDVFEFIFELIEPEEIEFQSGQFMMLDVLTADSFPQKRAYSIASPSFLRNKLRFCIKLIEDGVASTYFKNLKIGDTAKFQGPFGRFILDFASKKNLLFIATGTGVAPFIGMLEDIFEKKVDRKIEMYFGLRYEEDIFYQEILEKFAKEHNNFKYHLTVSRAKNDFKGLKGRITEYLDVKKYDLKNTQIYLCGGGEMVKEVRSKFLN